VLDLKHPRPIALTPPGVVRNTAVSPDGTRVAVLGADGALRVYHADGQGTANAMTTQGRLAPVLWASGDRVLVQHIGAYTQIPTSLS